MQLQQAGLSFAKEMYNEALQDSLPHLKDHLLSRLIDNLNAGQEPEYTPAERASIIIHKNRLFRHHVMRMNYTTYDLRRDQDSIIPRIHPDILVLSGETPENSEYPHPYWYARVIGIFHAQVLHVGPQSKSSELQRMEFLFVRWFGRDLDYLAGWKTKKLHRLGFINEFSFLDPMHIVRGVHIIPAFAHRQTCDVLGPSNIARPFSATDDDWQYFYVNMFVDRDMVLRYRSGGVGHKSTREATDFFKSDRDALDVKRRGWKRPTAPAEPTDEDDEAWQAHDNAPEEDGEGSNDIDDMEHGEGPTEPEGDGDNEGEEYDSEGRNDEGSERDEDNEEFEYDDLEDVRSDSDRNEEESEERDGQVDEMELLGYAEL